MISPANRLALLSYMVLKTFFAAENDALARQEHATSPAVFYVTNRQMTPHRGQIHYCASSADQLSFGRCLIFPHKESHSESANQQLAAVSVEAAPYSSEDSFFDAINEVRKSTKQKRLIVFVHGYRRSFVNSMRVAAQMAKVTNLPIVAFAWPSRNHPLLYPADERQAQASAPYLKDFLCALERSSGNSGVSIVAHSLGSRVATWAVQHKDQAGEGYDHIFLVSPDMDERTFDSGAASLVQSSKDVRILVSKVDVRISASNLIHMKPRIGTAGSASIARLLQRPDSDCLVDFTKVDRGFLGHSIPYSLLLHLMSESSDRKQLQP